MSDVFGFAVAAAGDFLRDAAVDAGHELGVFDGPARSLGDLADQRRGRDPIGRRLRAIAPVRIHIDR